MNLISVNFAACDPNPSKGYQVWWRVAGSSDPLMSAGIFFNSPAVFTDDTNPPGTEYEGVIRSKCRGEVVGNPVIWTTVEESGSSSGGGPVGMATVNNACDTFPPDDLVINYAKVDGVVISGITFPVNPGGGSSGGTFIPNNSATIVVNVTGGFGTTIRVVDSFSVFHDQPYLTNGDYTFTGINASGNISIIVL